MDVSFIWRILLRYRIWVVGRHIGGEGAMAIMILPNRALLLW